MYCSIHAGAKYAGKACGRIEVSSGQKGGRRVINYGVHLNIYALVLYQLEALCILNQRPSHRTHTCFRDDLSQVMTLNCIRAAEAFSHAQHIAAPDGRLSSPLLARTSRLSHAD